MQELLEIYRVLLTGATDPQIAQHLEHLIQDYEAMKSAIQTVLDQAHVKSQQVQ